DPRRELTRVEVPPPPRPTVVALRRTPALRAGEGARPSVHPDDHLLRLHVQLDAPYRPGRRQPQDRSVQLRVAHRSAPPPGRAEHSLETRSPTRNPEEPEFIVKDDSKHHEGRASEETRRLRSTAIPRRRSGPGAEDG